MQDNMQCRKCKAPTDKLKESTVSKHDVDGCCERHLHDSDSDYSDYDDASEIDLYDENEFPDEDDEDERNEQRNLNDLKKGENLSANRVINSRSSLESSIFYLRIMIRVQVVRGIQRCKVQMFKTKILLSMKFQVDTGLFLHSSVGQQYKVVSKKGK
jgi:hypothetical protein